MADPTRTPLSELHVELDSLYRSWRDFTRAGQRRLTAIRASAAVACRNLLRIQRFSRALDLYGASDSGPVATLAEHVRQRRYLKGLLFKRTVEQRLRGSAGGHGRLGDGGWACDADEECMLELLDSYTHPRIATPIASLSALQSNPRAMATLIVNVSSPDPCAPRATDAIHRIVFGLCHTTNRSETLSMLRSLFRWTLYLEAEPFSSVSDWLATRPVGPTARLAQTLFFKYGGAALVSCLSGTLEWVLSADNPYDPTDLPELLSCDRGDEKPNSSENNPNNDRGRESAASSAATRTRPTSDAPPPPRPAHRPSVHLTQALATHKREVSYSAAPTPHLERVSNADSAALISDYFEAKPASEKSTDPPHRTAPTRSHHARSRGGRWSQWSHESLLQRLKRNSLFSSVEESIVADDKSSHHELSSAEASPQTTTRRARQAQSQAAPPPGCPFHIGQHVEYFSKISGEWVKDQITAFVPPAAARLKHRSLIDISALREPPTPTPSQTPTNHPSNDAKSSQSTPGFVPRAREMIAQILEMVPGGAATTATGVSNARKGVDWWPVEVLTLLGDAVLVAGLLWGQRESTTSKPQDMKQKGKVFGPGSRHALRRRSGGLSSSGDLSNSGGSLVSPIAGAARATLVTLRSRASDAAERGRRGTRTSRERSADSTDVKLMALPDGGTGFASEAELLFHLLYDAFVLSVLASPAKSGILARPFLRPLDLKNLCTLIRVVQHAIAPCLPNAAGLKGRHGTTRSSGALAGLVSQIQDNDARAHFAVLRDSALTHALVGCGAPPAAHRQPWPWFKTRARAVAERMESEQLQGPSAFDVLLSPANTTPLCADTPPPRSCIRVGDAKELLALTNPELSFPTLDSVRDAALVIRIPVPPAQSTPGLPTLDLKQTSAVEAVRALMTGEQAEAWRARAAARVLVGRVRVPCWAVHDLRIRLNNSMITHVSKGGFVPVCIGWTLVHAVFANGQLVAANHNKGLLNNVMRGLAAAAGRGLIHDDALIPVRPTRPRQSRKSTVSPKLLQRMRRFVARPAAPTPNPPSARHRHQKPQDDQSGVISALEFQALKHRRRAGDTASVMDKLRDESLSLLQNWHRQKALPYAQPPLKSQQAQDLNPQDESALFALLRRVKLQKPDTKSPCLDADRVVRKVERCARLLVEAVVLIDPEIVPTTRSFLSQDSGKSPVSGHVHRHTDSLSHVVGRLRSRGVDKTKDGATRVKLEKLLEQSAIAQFLYEVEMAAGSAVHSPAQAFLVAPNGTRNGRADSASNRAGFCAQFYRSEAAMGGLCGLSAPLGHQSRIGDWNRVESVRATIRECMSELWALLDTAGSGQFSYLRAPAVLTLGAGGPAMRGLCVDTLVVEAARDAVSVAAAVLGKAWKAQRADLKGAEYRIDRHACVSEADVMRMRGLRFRVAVSAYVQQARIHFTMSLPLGYLRISQVAGAGSVGAPHQDAARPVDQAVETETSSQSPSEDKSSGHLSPRSQSRGGQSKQATPRSVHSRQATPRAGEALIGGEQRTKPLSASVSTQSIKDEGSVFVATSVAEFEVEYTMYGGSFSQEPRLGSRVVNRFLDRIYESLLKDPNSPSFASPRLSTEATLFAAEHLYARLHKAITPPPILIASERESGTADDISGRLGRLHPHDLGLAAVPSGEERPGAWTEALSRLDDLLICHSPLRKVQTMTLCFKAAVRAVAAADPRQALDADTCLSALVYVLALSISRGVVSMHGLLEHIKFVEWFSGEAGTRTDVLAGERGYCYTQFVIAFQYLNSPEFVAALGKEQAPVHKVSSAKKRPSFQRARALSAKSSSRVSLLSTAATGSAGLGAKRS